MGGGGVNGNVTFAGHSFSSAIPVLLELIIGALEESFDINSGQYYLIRSERMNYRVVLFMK